MAGFVNLFFPGFLAVLRTALAVSVILDWRFVFSRLCNEWPMTASFSVVVCVRFTSWLELLDSLAKHVNAFPNALDVLDGSATLEYFSVVGFRL